MFRLKDSIHVNAPIERCFLLSTSLELVQRTLRLRPTKGKTSGLVVGGDRLVWRGWKFGVPVFHETLITGYDRAAFFQDTMGRGMFQQFQHDHHFQFVDGQTLMYDIVKFSLPLGWPGKQVAKRVVVPHVLQLLGERFQMIKRIAESESEWKQYIPDSADVAIAEAATVEARIQSA